MKTGEQVEGFFFRRMPNSKVLFLLLKRTPQRGGFWQPLTGGAEEGETLEQALRREAKEEVGVTNFVKLLDTGFHYSFSDHGTDHTEYVYGIEVAKGTQITLSGEHEEMRWVEKSDVQKMLKWPGNLEGFSRLCKELKI